MVLSGSKWFLVVIIEFSVVYNGSQWFWMLFGGYNRVSSGFQWFLLVRFVLNGSKWLLLINGLKWLWRVVIGFKWFSVALSGFEWFWKFWFLVVLNYLKPLRITGFGWFLVVLIGSLITTIENFREQLTTNENHWETLGTTPLQKTKNYWELLFFSGFLVVLSGSQWLLLVLSGS